MSFTPQDLRNQLSAQFTSCKEKSCMHLEFPDKPLTERFAFFPYGNGLYEASQDAAGNEIIMIVGQDFGTVDYVNDEKFKQLGELDKPTMRNLKTLLSKVGGRYFLTNLFMGLRNEKKMTGSNPGLVKKEKDYLEACFDFFEKQVAAVNPRLIIVLGKVPYNYLCKILKSGSTIKTFEEYYQQKDRLQYDGKTIICIQHPSMWNSNVKSKEDLEKFIKFYLPRVNQNL